MFQYFITLLYLAFNLFILSVISVCVVFYFFPSLSIVEVISNGLEEFPEITVSFLNDSRLAETCGIVNKHRKKKKCTLLVI